MNIKLYLLYYIYHFQRLGELEECVKPLPALSESVNRVREEHVIHSQYAAAMENLKHIFTVPESVEKTKQWINEGKLLHAHQSLTDLENSRDDLLYEVHRLPSHSPQDKLMLKVFIVCYLKKLYWHGNIYFI